MRPWPQSTRTSAWRLSARSRSRGFAVATSPPAYQSCSASCSRISARSAARCCPWPAVPSEPRRLGAPCQTSAAATSPRRGCRLGPAVEAIGLVSMAAFRSLCAVVCASALCSGTAYTAQPHGRQAAVQPSQPAAPGQPPAGPAPEMKIAAVVNDEVISVFDVVSRMRMVMISSSIADTPEMRQRIGPQVLRSLIDEKLELQEAKRQSVTATDAEVNNGLQQIEKQNNMKSGQLNEMLKARGIDRGALVDQLTAGIVWAKLGRRQAAQTT